MNLGHWCFPLGLTVIVPRLDSVHFMIFYQFYLLLKPDRPAKLHKLTGFCRFNNETEWHPNISPANLQHTKIIMDLWNYATFRFVMCIQHSKMFYFSDVNLTYSSSQLCLYNQEQQNLRYALVNFVEVHTHQRLNTK